MYCTCGYPEVTKYDILLAFMGLRESKPTLPLDDAIRRGEFIFIFSHL